MAATISSVASTKHQEDNMTVVAPIDGAVETGEEEEGRREGKGQLS